MPLLTTLIDFLSRGPLKPSLFRRGGASSGGIVTRTNEGLTGGDPEISQSVLGSGNEDPDMKLPERASLLIMLAGGQLHQFAFYILLPSSNEYAKYLGGTSTFAGLVIGVPMAVSLLLLYPMSQLDKNRYARPLHICNVAGVLGSILYALGYRTNYLYTLLIGRILSGVSLTFLMFIKRYVTDPRLVGIRRRTTISSWLVFGQGVGFSAGPFVGGLLYKTGFHSKVWNGYTSPAWIISVIWVLYLVAGLLWFVDAPPENRPPLPREDSTVPLTTLSTYQVDTETTEGTRRIVVQPSQGGIATSDSEDEEANRSLTWYQKGTIACMCWYAMTCFYILGAWESNIPVFTSSPSVSSFNYSPYAAGNFIALGGVATFPFLLGNVLYARRLQDRFILASGASIGMSGLLIMLACFSLSKINFASFWICWFLVALGFNLASTCTLTLMSKQLPGSWNGVISLLIQVSNYIGRVVGAVWGGSGVQIGVENYLGMQIAVAGVGIAMHSALWKHLKAKTG